MLTVNFGGEVIMVWGNFSMLGLGPLLSVNVKLNHTDFRQFVASNRFGEGTFLFQYNCAPVHKTRFIKTWFDKFGVKELKRPAQSSDLNPIKQLWVELERQLQGRPPRPTSVHDVLFWLNKHKFQNSCGNPF